MPALAAVPGCLKIQFVHSSGGVPAWTHWFARYAGNAPAAADAIAIANSIKSAWTTNFAPLCDTQTSLTYVLVTDLSSPTGGQGQSGGGAVLGSRAGTVLTSNDCALMNLKIGRRYRGGKPKQFWPFGIVNDIADKQHWLAAFVNSMQAGWNAVNTAINAITWTGGNITGPAAVSYYGPPNKVVTSPTTGRARNVPTARATPLVDNVVSASCNTRIATQRRREHFSA